MPLDAVISDMDTSVYTGAVIIMASVDVEQEYTVNRKAVFTE